DGTTRAEVYQISGWYKATAAIAAGVRIAVVFGGNEDFTLAAATGSHVVIANGAAPTGWQWVSDNVTVPDDASWTRLTIPDLADGVGGVTLYFDDFSARKISPGLNAVNVLANPSFDFAGRVTSNPSAHYRHVLESVVDVYPSIAQRIDLTALEAWHQECADT